MTIGNGSGSSRSARCSASTAAGSPRPPTTRPRPVPAAPARCVIEVVLVHVRRVHSDPRIGRGVYGARKVWHELKREQARGEHPELGAVPRCQVERLMRGSGLVGVRRGKQFVTTKPDQASARPPDRVKRNFNASKPNQLWVVDFTYVPTWSGTAFSAFVTDVFSRRIVGWRTKATMPTELPLDALEMALWTRAQAELVDGLVHHWYGASRVRLADGGGRHATVPRKGRSPLGCLL